MGSVSVYASARMMGIDSGQHAHKGAAVSLHGLEMAGHDKGSERSLL